MKAVIFILALICATAFAATLTSNQYEFLFTRFVEQYNKSYETNDFFVRFNIFKANLDMILAHNAKDLPWTMAVNEFADYTPQEFEQMMGLMNDVSSPYAYSKLVEPVRNLKIADKIDWRDKGVVNPIKNQASCGSCWAFAAVSALESAHALKTGSLLDVSEQELVDCGGAYGNLGCQGGLTIYAWEYIRDKGGLCLTTEYPYTARDESCRYHHCEQRVAPINGYKIVGDSDEAHLEALNAMPIAVSIAASSSSFQFYASGILTECSDRQINHAVNLVGYSNEGRQHYILRNSWGTSWGDQGYMRIATGSNLCGLTTSGRDSYPVL